MSQRKARRRTQEIKDATEGEVIAFVKYIWNNIKEGPLTEAVKLSGLYKLSHTHTIKKEDRKASISKQTESAMANIYDKPMKRQLKESTYR